MAEVSYLRLPETVEAVEQEEIFAFDSAFPFCSLVFSSDSDPASLDDHYIHHASAFDPEIYNQIGGINSAASGSGSFEEISDHENQRVEQSHSHLMEIGSFESVPNFGYDFGLIDRNSGEIGANSLELEGEDPIGLGTIFNRNTNLDHDEGEGDNSGEFFVSTKEVGNNSGGNSTGEWNRSSGDSNLIHFASDSEEELEDLPETDSCSDDESHARNGNDHMNIALCWDSLQLEDPIDGNDEFEWEEVDAIEGLPIALPEEEQQASRNLEWQVLLNGDNLERNLETDNNEGFHFGGNEEYIYTAEYEMTIGQIAEGENPSISRPPASKLAVESLPSVTMTDEDVHNGNALCVVCKDEMSVGEQNQ
ncbi:hypothetical protein V2J09_020420 [Rumex salicifolius]